MQSDGLSAFLAVPPEDDLTITIGEVQRSVALDRVRLQEEIRTLRLQQKLFKAKEQVSISQPALSTAKPILATAQSFPTVSSSSTAPPPPMLQRSLPISISSFLAPAVCGSADQRTASPAPRATSSSTGRGRVSSPARPLYALPPHAREVSSPAPKEQAQRPPKATRRSSSPSLSQLGLTGRSCTPPPTRNARPPSRSPIRASQQQQQQQQPRLPPSGSAGSHGSGSCRMPLPRPSSAGSLGGVMPRGPFSPVRACHGVWRPPIVSA